MRRKMKQYLGKDCKLTLEVNGKLLFYTAKEVLDVSGTHITFIDKNNEKLSYRLIDLVEVHELR